MKIQRSLRSPVKAAAFVLATGCLTLTAVACGSSAKSASTPAPASTVAQTSGNGGGAGGRNRPEIQTSIAEGTPAPFGGNRTPTGDLATSIAQGTPPPFGRNRTPTGEFATAIAQGTPVGALRPFGGGGGARVITALEGVLGIDENALRTELQAPGASIEEVAAAHGIDRATLRAKLIAAVHERLTAAVASGALTQQQADDQQSQFEQNADSTIDRVGGGGVLDGPPPAPGQ